MFGKLDTSGVWITMPGMDTGNKSSSRSVEREPIIHISIRAAFPEDSHYNWHDDPAICERVRTVERTFYRAQLFLECVVDVWHPREEYMEQ